MSKKIVMAVVALAMAAVVGVSAFAAEGTYVPSITGGDDSTVYTPQDQGSLEAQQTYQTLVADKDATMEEKLAAVINDDNAAETISGVAANAGVASVEELTVRAVGDVHLAEGTTKVTLKVAGMAEGEVAVIMYKDANGNWVSTRGVVQNGVLTFNLPRSSTIIILTKRKVNKQ